MKSVMVLSLILLLPLVCAAALLDGVWRPVDVRDPKVVDVASFAVTEHNKQSDSDLRLDHVVEGQAQVAGLELNFKLKVAATDGEGGRTKVYNAIVSENPSEGSRSLGSFIQAD